MGVFVVVVIVQSPGHAEVADLDGFVKRDEAVAGGNVAVDVAHLVEETMRNRK